MIRLMISLPYSRSSPRPLDMNRAAKGVSHRFAHHLRQCRVGEYGGYQFGLRGLERFGDAKTLDELCRLSPDQMSSEQRARLGIEDGLHQSLRLAERDSLAIGWIKDPPDLELITAAASGLFGQADACHLRRAIGAAGDIGLVEPVHPFPAGDLFHADDSFVTCLVCEPRRADHVPDGIKTWCAGTTPFVDDDVALFDFDSLLLESAPLDISGDADGKDDALDSDLTSLAVRLLHYRGNAAIAFDEALYGRTGVDGDALLGEGFARERRDLGVLGWQDAIENLDDGHLCPKRAVEARKLDAYRA